MKRTALAHATHLAIAAMACSTFALSCAPVFAQVASHVPGHAGSSAQSSDLASPRRTQDQTTPTQNGKKKSQQTSNGKTQSKASSSQNATTLGTVQVTAQLGALRRAQSVKRNAIGIVDSISAEGVGKFPDVNVADALKRVPGVAVDAGGGEANKVTVRGFGPDFVNVLINGRTAASYSRYRAFNFDVLPSEIISSAQVQKTSTAMTEGGGIGGTINVITRRPLDYSGFHAHAKIQAKYDNTPGGPNTNQTITPKVAFTLNDTNHAHTFGWIASFVFNKRDHVEQEVETHGWSSQDLSDDFGDNYANVYLPHELEGKVNDESKVNRAIFGSLQWRPSDKFTARLDTLFSHVTETSVSHTLEFKPKASHIEAITTDANGTATSWQEEKVKNRYKMGSSPGVDAWNEQTGLNLQYAFNDTLRLTFDGSTSKSWRKQTDYGYSVELESPDHHIHAHWVNEKPDHFPGITDTYSPTDVSDLSAGYFEFGDNGGDNKNVSAKVNDYRLTLSKGFAQGVLAELDFGVERIDSKKKEALWDLPAALVNALYSDVDTPADAIDAKAFDAGSIVNDISPGFPHQFVQFDPYKFLAYLTSPDALAQHDDPDAVAALLAANNGMTPRVDPTTVSRVDEKINAAFVMANFTGVMGDHDWLLNTGVRYTKTKTTGVAFVVPLLALSPNQYDADGAMVPTFGALAPFSKQGSYSEWLPSASFKFHVRDNVIFRLAASKTIARAPLADLSPASAYTFTPDVQRITTGNVALKPFLSTNYDSSIEWYINQFSYMALDVFDKHVKNYPTLVTIPTTILGVPFLHTEPANLNKGTVKGAEATVVYQFQFLPAPLDGLGVAANYTYVTSNSSLHQGAGGVNGEFAIPGIGNTYNFNLYYDKGAVSARLAYNWRGKYLEAVAGDEGQPTTASSFGQLDFSASYRISRHVSLSFNAINLTNQTTYYYQIYRNRADTAQKNGRRFELEVHLSL